jgi:hypothetical protein
MKVMRMLLLMLTKLVDSDSDIIFSDNYEENLASDDELSDQSWRGD